MDVDRGIPNLHTFGRVLALLGGPATLRTLAAMHVVVSRGTFLTAAEGRY